jgi:ATP-dependent Clp protease adaptor protein ClpS
MESEPTKSGSSVVAAPKPAKTSAKRKLSQLPPYHVILLNDDDHTFEYVMEMLKVLFAHSEEKGYEMAKEVDREGRVIVLTTHREMAELKRDQIHAYGADARVATCKGSMSSIIEPAE